MNLKVLLTAGLLLAGLCAWLALRPDSEHRVKSSSALRSEEAAGKIEGRLAVELEPRRAEASASKGPLSAERTPMESDGEVEERWIEVEGRFLLRNEEGQTRSGLAGQATFRIESELGGTVQETHPVVAGGFRLKVLSGSQIVVSELLLDGAPAVPLMQGPRPATEDYPMLVHVRRPPRLVFEVIDAERGFHIDRVTAVTGATMYVGETTIYSKGAYPNGTYPFLQEMHTLFEGERSPIVLEDKAATTSRSVRLYFVSPGYAWKPVGVDLSDSRLHEVKLDRGASAEIFLQGPAAPREAYLRLWVGAEEGRPDLMRRIGEQDRFLLEGLRAGEHVLRVDFQPWQKEPTMLARTSFIADPDEPASLVVTLDATAMPRRSPLSGTLRLPAYWRNSPRSVLALETLYIVRSGDRITNSRARLQRLAFKEMEQVSDELFRWDAGEVWTGRYDIYLPAPYIGIVVDVGPGGVGDAHLEVPPPGELLVEVVDHDTGRPMDEVDVFWSPVSEVGARERHLPFDETLGRDEQGQLKVTAPIGEIEVSIRAEGYSESAQRAQVRAEPSRFTFLAQRQIELRLEFRSSNLRVTPPLTLRSLVVERLGGVEEPDRAPKRVGYRVDEDVLVLDDAGRYRLTFPELEGYAPVAPQELDVEAGGRVLHVIDLVRE